MSTSSYYIRSMCQNYRYRLVLVKSKYKTHQKLHLQWIDRNTTCWSKGEWWTNYTKDQKCNEIEKHKSSWKHTMIFIQNTRLKRSEGEQSEKTKELELLWEMRKDEVGDMVILWTMNSSSPRRRILSRCASEWCIRWWIWVDFISFVYSIWSVSQT